MGSGICQGCLLPSGTWQLHHPLPPSLLPPWDSVFGAAYLCFQCAGQAELCIFLVCELFQHCSVPAVVGGSGWQPNPQPPQGLDLAEALRCVVAQLAQLKVAVVAGGISPGGRAVCLPGAMGVHGCACPSLWRMGQAAVSGEQLRGRSEREVGAVVSAGRGAGAQLWQCLAKKRPLGLERKDGESPISLWCSWLVCLGFQWLLWRLSLRLLSVLLQTGRAVVGSSGSSCSGARRFPTAATLLACPQPSKPSCWSYVDVLPALHSKAHTGWSSWLAMSLWP